MSETTQTTSRLQGVAGEVNQSAKEDEVRSFARTGDGGGVERQLLGSGVCYRHDWGDRNGQLVLNLNWGEVTKNSFVFVAIGEGAPGGGKFIGTARYTLHNVAPGDGRVSIWVNIEYSSPIRLYVDYFLVNV